MPGTAAGFCTFSLFALTSFCISSGFVRASIAISRCSLGVRFVFSLCSLFVQHGGKGGFLEPFPPFFMVLDLSASPFRVVGLAEYVPFCLFYGVRYVLLDHRDRLPPSGSVRACKELKQLPGLPDHSRRCSRSATRPARFSPDHDRAGSLHPSEV